MFHHYQNANGCIRSVSNIIRSSPHWTEQFQSICVGLGALFAGIGGLKIGLDWLQQEKLKRKVQALKKKYPLDSLDSEYQLVDTDIAPGKWQLLDIPNQTIHWIKNLETTRELGWTHDKVRRKKNEDLSGFQQGEPIDTTKL